MDYIIGFVCGFLAGVVVAVYRLSAKKENHCSRGYDYEVTSLEDDHLDFKQITEELNKEK